MPWNLDSYTEYEKNYIANNLKNKTDQQIADDLGMPYSKVINYIRLSGLSRKDKFNINDYSDVRDIPGFSNYGITETGVVFNKNRNKIITPHTLRDGYIEVRLVDDSGKRVAKRLNRLVASVYLENDDPENKTEVDHLNGDIKNNGKDNLEWVTPEENNRRKIEGRKDKDKKMKETNNKLSRENVKEICRMLEDGTNFDDIVNYAQTNGNFTNENARRNVYKIKNRKSWQDISINYKF